MSKSKIFPLIKRLTDESDFFPDTRETVLYDDYALVESIRLNLECILNTKKCSVLWNDKYKYLDQSVINYGINDLCGIYFYLNSSLENECENIKRTILLFENRLENVTVYLNQMYQGHANGASFNIEAQLIVEKKQKSIIYDAHMLHPTRKFYITFSEGAGEFN